MHGAGRQEGVEGLFGHCCDVVKKVVVERTILAQVGGGQAFDDEQKGEDHFATRVKRSGEASSGVPLCSVVRLQVSLCAVVTSRSC